MKKEVRNLEVNTEFLESHSAVPFTLNKRTTGDHIHSWNTAPSFFPESMRGRENAPIRIRFLMDHAHQVGLDDLAMPDQPTGPNLIEECHEITYEEFVEYYTSNTYKEQGTIWNVAKNYTTIFMTKETHDRILEEFGRSVSLVYPAADCAVVRFYDPVHEVIGLTHSDAARTTDNIVGHSIKYMVEHFGSSLDDIEVYVGAFASHGWTYDIMPGFASEKDSEGKVIGLNAEWENYIEEVDGRFLIHYGDKIYDQIEASGVNMEHIYFDPDNTLFHNDYFSNARSYNSRVDGVPAYREGRNLFGITFDKDRVTSQSDENGTILR